jgi:uncharacterized membrane protein YgcG
MPSSLKPVVWCLVTASLLAFAVPASAAVEIPANDHSHLADPSELLTPSTAAQVRSDLSQFQSTSGSSVNVVIVKSTGSESPSRVAQLVFELWDLGPKDAVLVAVTDSDSGAVFAGPQAPANLGAVPSGTVIAQQLKPRLHANDPNEAVRASELALTSATPIEANYQSRGTSDTSIVEWTVCVIVVLVVAGIIINNERPRWFGGPWTSYGTASGWSGGTTGGGAKGDEVTFRDGGASGAW